VDEAALYVGLRGYTSVLLEDEVTSASLSRGLEHVKEEIPSMSDL
jgi:hypothetical protein